VRSRDAASKGQPEAHQLHSKGNLYHPEPPAKETRIIGENPHRCCSRQGRKLVRIFVRERDMDSFTSLDGCEHFSRLGRQGRGSVVNSFTPPGGCTFHAWVVRVVRGGGGGGGGTGKAVWCASRNPLHSHIKARRLNAPANHFDSVM
jgi:hypothetical protein